MKNIVVFIMFFLPFALFSQNERVFTGKCAISQTGGGTGFWQVGITNFNDPGGQFTAEDIAVNDYLFFSDSGTPYSLQVTEIVSASGSNATIKVSNVGITGISSVPTTTSSFVSRKTVNYGLFPWVANIPANENQLQNEYLVYLIDSLLNISGGGGGITAINSQTGPTQTLSVGTSGTDFTITSGSNIHVFQMPSASASARGLVTTGSQTFAGQKTFTNSPIMSALTASLPVKTASDKSLVAAAIDLSGPEVTGVLPSGSIPDIYWNKTTDQLGMSGVKQTTGIVAGSGSLLSNQRLGSTSQVVEAYKSGNVAIPAESTYQDWDGVVRYHYASGSSAETREIFTGSDTGVRQGLSTTYIRPPGVGKNVILNMTRGSYSADLPYVNIGQAGTASAFFNATYNSALNVPATGMAIEGSVHYLFTTLGGNSGEDFRIVQKNGATYTTTASINATVNGWNVGSDRRLKHDIAEIELSPETIRKFSAKRFKWNHSGVEDLGVIAQDFQGDDILSLVLRGNDKEGLQVNPLGIAALGIEAAAVLQKQIDVLNAQIDRLEQRIKELEK